MPDPVVPAAAIALVRRRLAVDRRAVVLVDGRSGAGKSTFASDLRVPGAHLLRLDDLYPGWDGLDAAATALVDRVLRPRLAGAPGAVRGWDWQADRPGEAFAIPVDGPLVVEGCGAITRRSAPFAAVRLWLELPEPERRRRALARDGDAFAPHWDRWARQEALVLARDDPIRLADVVVDARGRSQRSRGAHPVDAQYP